MPQADPAGQPLVSVIMPAHNAGRFIGSAIRSVLAQTHTNLELIVVDDASTDDTARIVAGFDDPRIRLIASERIGRPSGVRNLGLRQCRGDFIGFLDADDEFLPDALSTMVAALLANPSWDAVDTFSFHINEAGEVLEGELLPAGDGQYQIPPHFLPWGEEAILTLRTMNALPAFLLRRSAFERTGGFNETLLAAEDFEYKIRMVLDGLTIGRIPCYSYRYRVYPTSVTKDAGRYPEILESNLALLDWFVARMKHPERYRELIVYGYGRRYYNVIREQLNAGNAKNARNIVCQARQDPRLPLREWLRVLLPLYIRACIPPAWNHGLVHARRECRKRLKALLAPGAVARPRKREA